MKAMFVGDLAWKDGRINYCFIFFSFLASGELRKPTSRDGRTSEGNRVRELHHGRMRRSARLDTCSWRRRPEERRDDSPHQLPHRVHRVVNHRLCERPGSKQ